MQLELTILTPEQRLTLPNLRQVVFQSAHGEVGLLPGHAAMISLCACGIVRAFSNDADANDPPRCFVVETGLMRAHDDHLVLSTKRVCHEDELDVEAAQDAFDEATAMLATLDPFLDEEIHDEWLRNAAFCEAVLALDRELSQRHPNLASVT